MEDLIKEAIISFNEILRPTHFEKGEILLEGNTRNRNMFLVESGTLRSYYYANGKDVTSYFAMDYSIIGAIDSIVKDQKSIYHIEALEKSFVYLLQYSELDKFLIENPKLERLARQISQSLYFELAERMESMTFLTAKEKYDRLISKYPKITQKASLGHIASYLGITQETLSRVRRQS